MTTKSESKTIHTHPLPKPSRKLHFNLNHLSIYYTEMMLLAIKWDESCFIYLWVIKRERDIKRAGKVYLTLFVESLRKF